jgi:hypothetical protein
MPFLHWANKAEQDDIVTITELRKKTNETQIPEEDCWTQIQKLHWEYLYDSISRGSRPLHLRRTLDQYHYRTLENTEKRDGDQVMSRFCSSNSDLFGEDVAITMVDQLWLWILPGYDKQPDTVLTAFPCNPDPDSTDSADCIDWSKRSTSYNREKTNVCENIKHYLEEFPDSVEAAHELATIVTRECSKVYLHHMSSEKILQFREIYENSISNIVSTSANQICAPYLTVSCVRSTKRPSCSRALSIG